MTTTFGWRHKLLAVVLSTMATLVVVAVCGEIAVRYRERHRSTVPGGMPFIYYRHATLGHALVRGFNYYDWVHTNAQGFRGTRPVSQERVPGVTRILAVGGSTTFDSFVTTDSAAWPARLEYWLGRLAPRQRVEVINAGVPGYSVAQDLIRLETELYVYKPDLILFYQGHNDLIANLRPIPRDGAAPGQRPNAIRPVTPWRSWLEQHSLLYAKAAERFKLKRWARTSEGQAPLVTLRDYGAERFERLVSEYLAVASVLNIRVVIPEVVQISGNALKEGNSTIRAMWQATMPYVSQDTILHGYQAYNEVLREVSARAGVTFIPMLDLGIAGVESYADGDPIHFSDIGADRFAKGLAERLLARGLLVTPVDSVLRPAAKQQPQF